MHLGVERRYVLTHDSRRPFPVPSLDRLKQFPVCRNRLLKPLQLWKGTVPKALR